MRHEYLGWWDYDSSRKTLVNRLTSQQLQKVKPIKLKPGVESSVRSPTARVGDYWLFRYCDDEVEVSFAARLVWAEYQGKDHSHRWQVDYNLSDQYLTKMNGAANQFKSRYGLWSRVHNCITDGLCLWPELRRSSGSARLLETIGGWVAGQWNQDHWESFSGLVEPFFNDGTASIYANGDAELAVPELISLQAEAQHVWKYYPNMECKQGAKIDSLVLDMSKRVHGGETLTFDFDAELTGFEKTISYVKREDGNAVLFPSNIIPAHDRAETYGAKADFIYVDDEIAMILPGTVGEVDLGRMRDCTSRKEEKGGAGRFRFDKVRAFPRAYPDVDTCYRIRGELINAWYGWADNLRVYGGQRLLDDPSVFESYRGKLLMPAYEYSGIALQLDARRPLEIKGQYLAGFYQSNTVLHARSPRL